MAQRLQVSLKYVISFNANSVPLGSVCFVVLEEGADAAKVEETIKNMPNYFADYDTTVHFISEEELKKNHSGIPHGGFVIRTGKTGWNKENNHVIEYSLKLDSNPEFTSCVIVAQDKLLKNAPII